MEKTKTNQSVNASEIAKKVRKSGSTISVSLKILQKNRIVERTIMNKNSKLTNDIGYKNIVKLSSNSYLNHKDFNEPFCEFKDFIL